MSATPHAPTRGEIAELLAHVRAGRHPQAESRVRGLLGFYPSDGFLWKVLGVSMWAQGKDALHALERTATLLPQDAEAHSNLGRFLCEHGRPAEAVDSYRRALALRPDFAATHVELGSALQALDQLRPAAASYDRALALKPDDAETHDRLGGVLYELGEYEQAAASCRRALALCPERAATHANLAMVLMVQNRPAEAAASCCRALELDPTLSGASVMLAELTASKGKFEEAERLLRNALSIDRDIPEAWELLGRWRRSSRADHAWLSEVQRLARLRLPARREIPLRYALGKYFDEVGEYQQAFDNYRRANELTRMRDTRYDRDAYTRQVDLLLRTQNGEWLRRAENTGQASERAVFIVGMWRSGTTLTEQILASHPAVFGAGEIAFWEAAAGRYGQASPIDKASAIGRLADEYLGLLDTLAPAAGRVLDKMCSNFLHLGLIHAALPRARIIHMQRHPIDTCLSIYFQDFLHGHPYAHDLGDLAHYYREYLRVMEHWRHTLPADVLLEVPYEALVDDQAAWSRRMLEFLGLPWDPGCLEFYRTSRTVMTKSKWQVRQAISRSSIERWRNYAPHIAPLLPLANAPTESVPAPPHPQPRHD